MAEAHPHEALESLAQRCGKSSAMVTKILSLSRCIPAWHEAAEAGRVCIGDWYEASRHDEKGQHELLALKLTDGVSRGRARGGRAQAA